MRWKPTLRSTPNGPSRPAARWSASRSIATCLARPPTRARTGTESMRQGLNVPVVIKGVITPEDAKTAIARGASGLVVSNHGGADSGKAPIEVLAEIADIVGGEVPLLIDGGFRRGTDLLMALVLGA